MFFPPFSGLHMCLFCLSFLHLLAILLIPLSLKLIYHPTFASNNIQYNKLHTQKSLSTWYIELSLQRCYCYRGSPFRCPTCALRVRGSIASVKQYWLYPHTPYSRTTYTKALRIAHYTQNNKNPFFFSSPVTTCTIVVHIQRKAQKLTRLIPFT